MPGPPDPLRRFEHWLRTARRAGVHEPEAMTLATAARGGRPSARIVLLRRVDRRGLVFFTNYRSRKGRDLAGNPRAALVFHWPGLDRQVRLEGSVTPVSAAESDRYFAGRPRGAQLAAWASSQSRAVADRAALLRRFHAATRRFRGGPVPRPPHWGGFRLRPIAIEFWRSGAHRLHDRIRFERGRRGWRARRLAP